MIKLKVTLITTCVLAAFAPADKAGAGTLTNFPVHRFSSDSTTSHGNAAPAKYMQMMYDNLCLQQYGLSRNAWNYACKGYRKLLAKGRIQNPGIISICDFGLSSRKKRLFIIDIEKGELLVNTYVAHGQKTGAEYARSFSNRMNSHQSSLGFYITGNTYYGGHGFSLRIQGVEPGINDKAMKRNIVVHGSDYATDRFLRANKFLGRSYGCPAIPNEETGTVINAIKEGTCFFIYHPSKTYLAASKMLND